ncbi:MAG: beta-ketoacyl-[acyl-carrier-protein] synthase II [Legionellales bacterium]|nr:beta-ketoacyl-[acyl-carrier-protein] synthase II [Legionellales bacterium]OUX64716.1 MAG: beta-ketoacyl-[acyl-carrier-protein] synthase II [Gammaproteobacteria bacterium TMED281]
MTKKVVVTAMGAVSPIGSDLNTIWDNTKNGVSGISKITHMDTENIRTKICGVVKDTGQFELDKQIKRCDPFIQYAVWATEKCFKEFNISSKELNPSRSGVIIGSGIGGLSNIEYNHKRALESPKKISPFFLPCSLVNMASGIISMKYNLKGPSLSISTACATGIHAITLASQMIQTGQVDFVVAGGAEKGSDLLGIGGFSAMRALSARNDDPKGASRPWDKDRDGFVLSDGAAVLILESEEHAKNRNAKILAEVSGCGMSSDAYHMTQPDPTGSGAMIAMENAILDANIDATEIGYINAHATSTPIGDIVEPRAIQSHFGKHTQSLKVSSTKSVHGHLLGAAGAFESILTILSLNDQIAPPTINLNETDIDIDLNLVPNHAQSLNCEYAICNSFGFGGTNGSIIFKRA